MILGYYIYLAKSILVPCQVVQYLGFLVDSCKQAFLLLEEKQQKFCLLLQSILASEVTDVKTLQHLSGKCKYNHINDSLRSVCCKCVQRTRISVTSPQSFVPKKCRTFTFQKSFFIRTTRIWNLLITRLDLDNVTFENFKSVLYGYYSRALAINYDPDSPRSFKSICLKCNTARFLDQEISCHM